MADRRRNSRKRRRSLAETSQTNSNQTQNEQQSDPFLPREILESILSRLTLRDNIRASTICRSWLVAAESVRISNRPPWLMSFPKSDFLFQLYDPFKCKRYYLKLPELIGSRVCYSKYGWLLLFKPSTERIFFFCPYTRHVIRMPKFQLSEYIAAFSDPPTSPSCTLFTVQHVSALVIAISTCRMGATTWTTVNYQSPLPSFSGMWNKLVFSNGLFYCFGHAAWLGVYDPEKHTWNLIAAPPKCMGYAVRYWWRGRFLAEHDGEMFIVCTCADKHPVVHKLDRTANEWKEVDSLDGLSIFVNFTSSHVLTDLLGKMRNRVYFPKVHFYGRRCVTYSFDSGRYCPREEFHDWSKQNRFDDVWIDAPPPELPMSQFIGEA